MSIVAIVQARMSSTRFPGKVLAPIGERPMILEQLDRVGRSSRIDRIVVATSDDPSDDSLAQVLQGAGYSVYRGPLDDVMARFAGAADQYQADAIVRITADCPLISPSVIDQVIEQFESAGVDYASNTLNPTYPDGLDVEVFRSSVLSDLARLDLDEDEREHVTLGIYRRPEQFTLHSVVDPTGDRSHLRWTVDTPTDLEFVTWIYGNLADHRPDFDYSDILELLTEHPEQSRTTDHGVRNAALIGKDTGAMRGPAS